MADFYAARSEIIPPLPWPTFAPPFSGADAGASLAKKSSLDALFLVRDDAGGVQSLAVGRLFSGITATTALAVGD